MDLCSKTADLSALSRLFFFILGVYLSRFTPYHDELFYNQSAENHVQSSYPIGCMCPMFSRQKIAAEKKG